MDTTYTAKIRVIYADTDKMGVAYHANYLRWFEIGRNEMFRTLGMSYKQIEDSGFLLPVSEANCKFVAPAHYDDVLLIDTSIDRQIRGGIKFDYCIYREADHELLARGYTRHAFVDRNGKVVRPPRFMKDLIEGTFQSAE